MAVFKSFWHGERLSPYQWLCLKSFVDHGHDFVLYSYDRIDAPVGVELRDATQFLPRERVFFYSSGPGAGSVSAFSNLFRYRLLHDEGGWWVDTDVVCLSRDVPVADVVLGWQDESRDLVGSAVLKFPRAHHFVAELCRAAEEMGTEVEWGQAGPDLVTLLVRRHSLENRVSDASLMYPVPPRDAIHTLMPAHRDGIRANARGASFLHLWNEVLRRSAVLDAVAPPPGSFLGELFEKHDVKFPSGLSYSADEVQRLHDNRAGYLRSVGTDSEIATERATIAYLKNELESQATYFGGELAKARAETASAIADKDVHRQFMQRLSSSVLWRMSWPLRALAKRYQKTRNRSGGPG